MKVTLPELDEHENEIYKIPKYKPGDFIAVKFKMYTDGDETDHFEYRHYIILYVDSSFYKLLRLENISDNANSLFITTYEIPIIDDNESKLLYHFDADKIREMCQDDAGFEDN